MDPAEFNDTADPFHALGIAPSFDLTPAAIERAYLAKAAQAHPDLNQTGETDPDAPTSAAALNKARARLLDAEARAAALLARLGGPGPSDDRSLPDGFLQDMMTTRLEIEEAIASDDRAAVAPWRQWAAEQRKSYIASTAAAFADLSESPDAPSLAAIRQSLNAWRYIERLIEQLPAEPVDR